MRLIVAASVVLLALTGCTPNTDEAYAVCTRSQLALWEAQHPNASVEQFADQAAAVADECAAAAKADPQGFIDTWSD